MELSDIVAISAVRTPTGRFGGSLRGMHVCDVGAVAIKEALKRAGITGDQVDELFFGNCRQAGNGINPARTASVRGGIPVTVPATTINMACPSGMMALAIASRQIRLGDRKIVVVGGMDSMSTIPFLLKDARWKGFKMGDRTLEDGWSDSIDPLIGQGMGDTAENLAEKYNISREAQDEFALSSHQKTAKAWENGWFDEEVTPIEVPALSRKEPGFTFSKDETFRPGTSLEKLAKLPTVFKKDGTVTPGNACGMSDGANALVITSREVAESLGAKPLFSLVSYSSVAVDPGTMGEGPGVAIPAALENANMSLNDMDFIEINEAFAVQVLANEQVLKFDMEKLNVHGGAIALGHPTGHSGSRIVLTLYNVMKNHDGEIGVAGICGGGGVSMATVIKREN